MVLHTVMPHTYGAQLVIPLGVHAPAPSHTGALVSVEPEHEGAPQRVPIAYFAHAPCPSQEPLVPQLGAPLSSHSVSGSVPAAMVPQAPSAPLPFLAAVQARQVPVQAVSQQTPSAQKPLSHSLALAQVPLALVGRQLPLARSQYVLAEQSASLMQALAQASPEHWNGEHACVPLPWQLPAPSQVLASVSTPALHVRGAHTVPAA